MKINTADGLLKTTSLLYLKEALNKGEFEDCKVLVTTAKTYGAAQSDIDEVIAAYLRGDQSSGVNEAFKGRNRLNLNKEKK